MNIINKTKRYLKGFTDFLKSEEDDSNLTTREILHKWGVRNYTINEDGTVSCLGEEDLGGFTQGISVVIPQSFKYTKLPIKFREISGSFYCSGLGLTTLEGCPEIVKGEFDCGDNNLKDLTGGPRLVYKSYFCDSNPLTSLNGLGRVGFWLICNDTKITNLVGVKPFVEKDLSEEQEFSGLIQTPGQKGTIILHDCPNLTSLDGLPAKLNTIDLCDCPNLFDIGNWDPEYLGNLSFGHYQIQENEGSTPGKRITGFTTKKRKSPNVPIFTIVKLFQNIKYSDQYVPFGEDFNEEYKKILHITNTFLESLRLYDYIRGRKVNKRIFKMMCEDYGLQMPTSLAPYEWTEIKINR